MAPRNNTYTAFCGKAPPMRWGLFLIIFSLLGFDAHAAKKQKPIKVQPLGPSCWLRPQNPRIFLASFADGVSVILNQSDADYDGLLTWPQINKAVTKALQAEGITTMSPSKARLDLMCNDIGHILLVNFYAGPTPMCAWIKGTARDGWNVRAIYSNPNPDKDSFCFGIKPKSLLMVINPTSDLAEAQKYLETNYVQQIEKIEPYVPGHFLNITLNEAFRFREKEVKQLLESDPTFKPHLKSIGWNSIVTLVGETKKILNFDYPGF